MSGMRSSASTASPRRRGSAGRLRQAPPASGGRSRSCRCRGRPPRGCRPRRHAASWWPDASAASTAPNTTSRSTLFSREMASTSISISRFIVLTSVCPAACAGAAPAWPPPEPEAALEIHHRHEARLAHFVEPEAQHLLGLAGSLNTGPPARKSAPSRQAASPSPASTPFQALRPWNGSFSVTLTSWPANRWKSARASQRPIQPRRRHFQPA
jgi:hypothetical protein